MAIVRVKSKFDILDAIKGVDSSTVKTEIAQEIITQVKDFTSKGISPIKGEARFASYKNPVRYPGKLKSTVPVNLRLTGDMLAALTSWITSTSLFIGFRDDQENKKALAHHTGTKDMAARPFIPMNEGEEFNVTITRKIRDIYSKALAVIIKKANR
jgi:hypothetical protein